MSFVGTCKCGEDLSGFLDNNVSIGVKLLYRSRSEYLNKQDYPLSIVFAATAMECQLSRLYFKWRRINSIRDEDAISDDQLERSLREFSPVDKKIDEIAKLMYPDGLAAFVHQDPELVRILSDGFPSLRLENLPKSFQKTLFWPRNKILHLGDSRFEVEQAKKCFNISTLGLRILESLDQFKIGAT